MKYALAAIGANIVALAGIIAATWLIAHDKDNWQWLLVIAAFGITTIKSYKEREEQQDSED